MDEMFYQKNVKAFYNINIDVKQFYKNFPISKKLNLKPNQVYYRDKIVHKLYRNSLIPLNIRYKLWSFFRSINLDLSWFNEFIKYWGSKIGGRPLLNVHDLFFLKNLLRIKFQDSKVPDMGDSHIHLEAWQRPELIYQLLHLVCRESVRSNYIILKLLRKFKKKFNSILEFGCATAPITTALYEFFHLHKNITIYLSDIQTIAFHYGAYKFRNCSNVIPILLTPENDFLLNLNTKVDVIFCITVFEHLNKPLKTIEIFHDILNKNGLLFMDYIITTGEALDTYQAYRERNYVLDFIEENFKIVYGKMDKEKSIGLTIVRKT